MKDFPFRAIRRFNPGMLQSDTEVIDQFVVRDIVLDIVIEVLRGNVSAQSCQHILVIAPRGHGKTMLLARVAAELRTDNGLSKRLLPIQVSQEGYGISDLADFWLEILLQLAQEVLQDDPVLGRELQATHARLSMLWRDHLFEDYARVAVLEAADQLDRQLVLMVENLQGLSVIQNEQFGWKLRQVMQTEPRVIVLATATSRFRGLDDPELPFFEFFRMIRLQPLSTDECRRLWQSVCDQSVSNGEIRAIEILTGGSPRLVVILGALARHSPPTSLMDNLATLLDELTEYFRRYVEILSDSERRIFSAVVDLWKPSKAREIAARSRRNIRIVSTMLGRLIAKGAVMVEGSGKKRLYSATERLYCVYYKLRRGRNEAAVVRNLIQFMSVFYQQHFKVESDQSDIGRYFEVVKGILDVEKSSEPTCDRKYLSGFAHDREQCIHKAQMQHILGNTGRELTVLDEIIDRFGESKVPVDRVFSAEALVQKIELLSRVDDETSVLNACDEFGRRFHMLPKDSRKWLGWRTERVRIKVLLSEGKESAILDAFRALYALFIPQYSTMVGDIIDFVRRLVISGIEERAVERILSSEQRKAAVIVPLIVALRRRSGEDVQAPKEVIEVAEDIEEYFRGRVSGMNHSES